MADKSWMLNPKAIRRAKECIHIIRELTGVKLKLSDPDFLQVLHQNVEDCDSADLGDAYARLISMAGVGYVVQNLHPKFPQESAEKRYKRASGDSAAITGTNTPLGYFG